MLAVFGERLFGFTLGRRQWMGIGLVAVGHSYGPGAAASLSADPSAGSRIC
jgi:hypothetical protein